MSRRIFTVLGLTALFAAVALTITWVFITNKGLFGKNRTRPVFSYAPDPLIAPEINLYKSGTAKKPTIIIAWKNLTPDMARIHIYRSGACGVSDKQLWKIIEVADINGTGALEVVLRPEEANCSFFYNVETLTKNGNVTWSAPLPTETTIKPPDFSLPPHSSSTIIDPLPQPPPMPIPPPEPSGPVPPSAPPTAPTSTGQASTTSSSTSPTAPQPPPPGGTGGPPPGPDERVYYDPKSQPTGHYTPQTGTFWVQHMTPAIEFGWQNLPSSTDGIIISRSSATDGPWSIVISQQHPEVIGPYTIRVTSDAVNQAFYYKLDTKENSTLISTYGPLLLPPSAQ